MWVACVNHVKKTVQHFANSVMMFCVCYRDNMIKDNVYINYELQGHWLQQTPSAKTSSEFLEGDHFVLLKYAWSMGSSAPP